MTLTDKAPKETDEMGDVAVVAVPEIRALSTTSTPNVDGNVAMSPTQEQQQEVEGERANADHSNKICIIGFAVTTVIAFLVYIPLGINVDWALGAFIFFLPVLYCMCWNHDPNDTRRWDGGGGGGGGGGWGGGGCGGGDGGDGGGGG